MPPAKINSLAWILEPLERDDSYIHKRMFGCDAGYIDGRLCLIAADRKSPWDGLLVCTSQEHHAALVDELPALQPHPVIGKWLYVPESDAAFEQTAEAIASLVLARDARIGVEPEPRNRRRALSPKRSIGQ
jgi:hypothetical protein